MCKRNGNPQKASRFICLRCEQENRVGLGIQRSKQREYLHIKDMMCISKTCKGMITKNVEVRYCDDYNDIYSHVPDLYEKYYDDGELKEPISHISPAS